MRIPVSINFPQSLSRHEPVARPGDFIGVRSENASNAVVDDREQGQGEWLQRADSAGIPDDRAAFDQLLIEHGKNVYRLQETLADIPPRNRPALSIYMDIQKSLEGLPAGVELLGVDLFI